MEQLVLRQEQEGHDHQVELAEQVEEQDHQHNHQVEEVMQEVVHVLQLSQAADRVEVHVQHNNHQIKLRICHKELRDQVHNHPIVHQVADHAIVVEVVVVVQEVAVDTAVVVVVVVHVVVAEEAAVEDDNY